MYMEASKLEKKHWFFKLSNKYNSNAKKFT